MYRSQSPLPHQVFTYYVLFSLLGLVVTALGLVYLARSQDNQAETRRVQSFVEQAKSNLANVAGTAKRDDAIQAAVEQIGELDWIEYCSFVGIDGVCLGHSNKSWVGKILPMNPEAARTAPAGSAGKTEKSAGRKITVVCEKGDEVLGTLQLGIFKNRDGVYARAISTCLCVMLVPLFLLMLVGGIVIRRLVQPIANIQSQLSRLAGHQSLEEFEMERVPMSDAVSLGWNRLVEDVRENLHPVEKRVASRVSNDSASGQEAALLDSFADGIAQTDGEGKISFINNAMKALLGVDAGEDGGTLPIRQYLEEGTVADPTELNSLFDSRAIQKTAVAEVTKNVEGGKRILRISRQPIRKSAPNSRASDQKPEQAWSVRDITQQRMADKARDEFLDSATHELRTPLANIKAYAETLQLTEMIDVEQQKEFCNVINSEATRLARFIDELLDVSSIEAGSLGVKLQKVEFARLLEEAISKVRPLMEQKQIEFQTVFSEKLPELEIDKDKFATCLVNLLGNAAKYTPEGGSVSFNARVVENELIIDVSDTGFGIAENELPHVFDKFYRSEDGRVRGESGTGLGLALTKEIIQLHQGTLTADSVLNEGSTFTISLPVS